MMKACSSDNLLSLEENITITMSILINILIILSIPLKQASVIFMINILIAAAIILAAYVHRLIPYTWLQTLRDWYMILFLIAIFLESRTLIPLINPHEMDSFIMAVDRKLFLGHDPTILLEKITHPALSELLQIFYTSFYFLPLVLCLILYFFRDTKASFHAVASAILVGFYISFLGYYLTPVIGPRYTMGHLFNIPLTGLLTFDFLRNLLAQLEGRMYDCMPSGHALVSLLTVLLSLKYAKSFFPFALVWAAFIIFSTVYLRYHYVTDIMWGIALCILIYLFGPSFVEASIIGSSKSTCLSKVKKLERE